MGLFVGACNRVDRGDVIGMVMILCRCTLDAVMSKFTATLQMFYDETTGDSEQRAVMA